MLISVITPTFNRANMLMKALASLKGQTYGKWESIVVDDGDGAGKALVESLNDNRFKAFQNPNKGQVFARNYATQQAKGEAIALLDDDDWFYDPYHLEKLASLHKQGAALLHSYGWMVKEENRKQTWELFDLEANVNNLYQNNSILTSSMSYPKALHDELGLFDTNIGGYFDWDWIIRVLDAGYPVKTLKSAGVCYRIHENSGSLDVHGERRTQSFSKFCKKHKLELEIKNHRSLLNEAS